MRQIIIYLKKHIHENFHPLIYGYVFLFLGIAIFINYRFNFENIILTWFNGNFQRTCYYFISRFTGYFGVIIPVLIIRKKLRILLEKQFWIKIISILVFFSIYEGWDIFSHFINSFNNSGQLFVYLVISNTKSLIILFIPVIVLKLLFDRHEKGLYGLRKKGFLPKPLLLIILILLPMATWASFQKDFILQYPTCGNLIIEPVFGLHKWQSTGIYELAYGSDFIITELIFRGVLVIGMSAILGQDAVIAMCGLYVMVHFGKPMAETISSFFGGYILGVIAFYYRNILLGCLVHLSLAYLMEAAALVQIVILGKSRH